jgi:hypothetical protein
MSSKLLNDNDRELTLDDLVDVRKQSVLEEAEEVEPELKEGIVTFSKLTEMLA